MRRFLLFSFFVAFGLFVGQAYAASITGPASISWGSTATLKVDGLQKPPTENNIYAYHVLLTKNNSNWKRDFDFFVLNDGSCLTDENDGGGYRSDDHKALANPTCSGSSISFIVAPNTDNKFEFPSNIGGADKITLQDTYKMTVTNVGNTPSFSTAKSFTVTATINTPRLEVSPGAIEKGDTVVFTATGCPNNGKFTFTWYESTSKDDFHQQKDVGQQDGKAIYQTSAFSKANADGYTAIATCSTTGLTSPASHIKIYKNGEEYTEVSPSNPQPGEAFKITVFGTEKDGQCYFYEIKDLTNGGYVVPDGRTLDPCTDGKIDTGSTANQTKDHKSRAYAAFASSAITYESPEITLPIGAYKFELYTPNDGIPLGGIHKSANGKGDDYHSSADLSFSVGDAEAPEDPDAPPPPCAKGIKYDFSKENNGAVGSQTDIQANVDLCTEYVSALGPIPTESTAFVGKFFAILLSISGGIILAMLIYSGYQIIMSQGNPDKIKEARERITSTIVGILFLVLSVIILQVIGVDILHLPGLGG